jgi:phospholipase D
VYKVILFFFISITNCFAFNFSNNANYKTCFTPGQDCTHDITRAISRAKKQILMQAYSFTSIPIAKALVEAKQRGVSVQILLDKSQERARNSMCYYLKKKGLKIKIDYKPAIAHNKVIIIDQRKVITGSFNFTNQAQKRNAENLLIVGDRDFAKKYIQNWNNRAGVSVSEAKYEMRKRNRKK